jgi:hypothetical protein
MSKTQHLINVKSPLFPLKDSINSQLWLLRVARHLISSLRVLYYTLKNQEEPIPEMTDEEANYFNRAVQTQKLPAQIIGDMVLEKIAASRSMN